MNINQLKLLRSSRLLLRNGNPKIARAPYVGNIFMVLAMSPLSNKKIASYYTICLRGGGCIFWEIKVARTRMSFIYYNWLCTASIVTIYLYFIYKKAGILAFISCFWHRNEIRSSLHCSSIHRRIHHQNYLKFRYIESTSW